MRAEAKAAGALATLDKPVGARILLDFLRSRTTGLTAQDDFSAEPAETVDPSMPPLVSTVTTSSRISSPQRGEADPQRRACEPSHSTLR